MQRKRTSGGKTLSAASIVPGTMVAALYAGMSKAQSFAANFCSSIVRAGGSGSRGARSGITAKKPRLAVNLAVKEYV
jgi:hypothetical protein